MPSWWRLLLAVALIAMIPFAVCLANADTQASGIFANGVDFGLDLDDDFDEMLRHLMPRVAAAGVATIASASRPLHLSRGPAGPGPTSCPGRTPADRAPPAAPARHQNSLTPIETPASVLSVNRLQPHAEQYLPAPSGPAASAPPFRHLPLSANTALSSSTCGLA